jgi:hypothetical protein
MVTGIVSGFVPVNPGRGSLTNKYILDFIEYEGGGIGINQPVKTIIKV